MVRFGYKVELEWINEKAMVRGTRLRQGKRRGRRDSLVVEEQRLYDPLFLELDALINQVTLKKRKKRNIKHNRTSCQRPEENQLVIEGAAKTTACINT